MLTILAVVALLAIAILLAVLLPVFMVRILIRMCRDGDRPGIISSGIAGMMTELDRVVRPSVQHIVEAKESMAAKKSVESHEDIDGE